MSSRFEIQESSRFEVKSFKFDITRFDFVLENAFLFEIRDYELIVFKARSEETKLKVYIFSLRNMCYFRYK